MNKLYILQGKENAYALLNEIAYKKFNSLEIVKNEHGKPYFNNADNFYFNISHTEGVTVLAVSEREVGVDVEKVRKANFKIAERHFLQNEIDYISYCDKRFFEVWTKKEAFLKYKGTGISGGLKSVNVFDSTPKIKTFFIDDCVISVCGETEFEIIK